MAGDGEGGARSGDESVANLLRGASADLRASAEHREPRATADARAERGLPVAGQRGDALADVPQR